MLFTRWTIRSTLANIKVHSHISKKFRRQSKSHILQTFVINTYISADGYSEVEISVIDSIWIYCCHINPYQNQYR